MQFSAFVVKQNGSNAIRLSLVGVILFLVSIFLWAFVVTETIALYVTITGFSLVLIGAIAGKGKGILEVTPMLLSIDEKQILVDKNCYSIEMVNGLQIHFDSFYSQSSFGYYTENAGQIEYGMTNFVAFDFKQEKVFWNFYIANIEQANHFFAVINVLQNDGLQLTLTSRMSR